MTHHREICCCNTSLCNVKTISTNISGGHDLVEARSHSLHARRSSLSIVSSGSLSWLFLSAVCGLILISACIGMIIVGVCRYTKRRRDHMTILYSELTTELGEEPVCDNDVGLLLP